MAAVVKFAKPVPVSDNLRGMIAEAAESISDAVSALVGVLHDNGPMKEARQVIRAAIAAIETLLAAVELECESMFEAA